MIGALDISRSALEAQRIRLDVIAGNIANAFATQQEDGTIAPYRRRFATFMAGDGQGGPGVHVASVEPDMSPFKAVYDPTHAHAGPDGYVQLPNVSITMEYIDAMTAARAYEANAAMLSMTRDMVRQALRLFA